MSMSGMEAELRDGVLEKLDEMATALGFVVDLQRCIGCHACTVGCKAENDVPLGAFRTWVKWIEHGHYPETARSAAVLRCNHCEDAPCVRACPTGAITEGSRPIGTVDRGRTPELGFAGGRLAIGEPEPFAFDERLFVTRPGGRRPGLRS